MRLLADTNVIVRYADSTQTLHKVVVAALASLAAAGRVPCIVPQTIYEFWVVATRPVVNNGLGMTVAECANALDRVVATFVLLPDPPNLYAEWRRLVEAHDCKGKVAHDARLVAAMRGHGVSDLLTFNAADFRRFPALG